MESSVLPGVSAKGHILFGIKAKSHVLYGDCLELVQNGRALSGVSAKSYVLFGGSGNPEPRVTPDFLIQVSCCSLTGYGPRGLRKPHHAAQDFLRFGRTVRDIHFHPV